jgi:hypothetical protein
MENQEQQPEVQQPEAKPELSISDLQNMKTLIDVASRRGAFSAAEMSSVGAVFDRVSAFLNAVAPPPAPQETDKPAE